MLKKRKMLYVTQNVERKIKYKLMHRCLQCHSETMRFPSGRVRCSKIVGGRCCRKMMYVKGSEKEAEILKKEAGKHMFRCPDDHVSIRSPGHSVRCQEKMAVGKTCQNRCM
jgi:hypothetical protein